MIISILPLLHLSIKIFIMILSRARIDLYPIIGFGRRAHKTAQTTCQEVLRWVIPHILWYYWTNNVGYVRHGIGMVVFAHMGHHI